MPTKPTEADTTVAERLRTLLANRSDVYEKKMFGSLAFLVNDKLCICAGKGRLMCRIDPDESDTLQKENGVTPIVMRGKKLRGYLEVPYANVTSKPALQKWLRRCLDYNATLMQQED